MRCKTCHYSLANLSGPPHRCPECGREFDPNDPKTFGPRSRRPYPYWNIVVLSLVFGWFTLVVVGALWAYFNATPGGWFSGARGALAGGFIIALFFPYVAFVPAGVIAFVWIMLERRRRGLH